MNSVSPCGQGQDPFARGLMGVLEHNRAGSSLIGGGVSEQGHWKLWQVAHLIDAFISTEPR